MTNRLGFLDARGELKTLEMSESERDGYDKIVTASLQGGTTLETAQNNAKCWLEDERTRLRQIAEYKAAIAHENYIFNRDLEAQRCPVLPRLFSFKRLWLWWDAPSYSSHRCRHSKGHEGRHSTFKDKAYKLEKGAEKEIYW